MYLTIKYDVHLVYLHIFRTYCLNCAGRHWRIGSVTKGYVPRQSSSSFDMR